MASVARVLAWMLVFVLVLPPLAAAEGLNSPDVSDVLETGYSLVTEPIRDAMQDRNYGEAIRLIDQQLAQGETDHEQLLYLKGRALHFAGRYEEAVETFQEQVKRFPQSTWTRKAQFAIGLAHARRGDFRSAEAAYREQARYLLSLDRKEEVAEIFLNLANEAFRRGEETQDQQNFTRALEFYRQAAEVGPKPQTKDQIDLQIARSLKQLGQTGGALTAYEQLISGGTQRSVRLTARYELGALQLGQQQLDAARKTWEDLLALHAKEDSDLLPQAAFRLAETYRFPAPSTDQDLELGVAALEEYISSYPEHERVPAAYFQLAKAYSHRGRGGQAVAALERFLKIAQFENTDAYAEARFLLGLVYAQQNQFDEAITTWREYLAQHPAHAQWSEAQQRIINTQYQKAEHALAEKRYAEARQLWQEFLLKYPVDSRSQQIQFRIAETYFAEEKWQEAITAWRQLVSKFPGSDRAAQAQYRVALTTEMNLKRLAEALELYKQLSGTSYAAQAQQRITLLTGEELHVATLRKFRSNQKPSIELKTRNLEKVRIQIYPIDLETYFRKMQTTGGIENLDIALIDPAESFTFEVPQYEKYRLDTHTVAVPFPSANDGDRRSRGVVAVTVTGEKREATTVVLQSDLDMIVKSSREEVFVYAQNMRTGEPWKGVRLLLSNGSEVFAEAETGADGVYRANRNELHSSADIRVLGVVDGHSAANVVRLDGLQVARGLERRGYLYTDRPAYRPGQLVHLRGIIRHVVDDRYVVPTQDGFRLEVIEPRGRSLYQEEVSLSDFGSAVGHLILPEEAPIGTYQVVLQSLKDKGETYRGSFAVAEFQLPRVYLKIETNEDVYYRGEVVQGTITARYYHGDPVVERNLQYFLDGRQIDAQTDREGKVRFEMPTRDLRDSKVVTIEARMPSENAAASKSVFLSAVGFTMTASVVRETYLSGESFDVTATVKDLEGEPLAQPLTLSVLRLPETQGQAAQEVLVEKHEVTANEQGEARHTLTLKEGGRYILRFTGTDRFDHAISAQATVKISDENDRVRLHILADRHLLKAGEKTAVNLHWRGEPTTALLTFEGSRILHYRLIKLQEGKNAIDFAVDSFLAPNFQLAVAAMTDEKDADQQDSLRFHSASSEFQVERELRIELKLPQNAAPGETVQAELRTSDALGNPVAAELSLALVEKSLLDQFPPAWPKPSNFWQGNRRLIAMRATSSIDFQYHPPTETISDRLLAEAERIEAEEEIRLRLREMNRQGAFDAPAEPSVNGAVAGMGGGFYGEIDSMAAGERAALSNAPPGTPAPQRQLLNGRQQVQVGERGALGESASEWSFFVPMNRPSGSLVPALEGTLGENLGRLKTFQHSQYWYDSSGQAQLGVQVLDARGRYSNMRFELGADGAVNQEMLLAFAQQADDRGDQILAGLGPQETAFWEPRLVTDEQGKATVEMVLPPDSTTWKLLAKGISVETLAGETEAELTAAKSLFAELRLPMALQSGDTMHIPVRIFKRDEQPGEVELSLKITIGEKSVTHKKSLEFAGPAEQDLLIPLELDHATGPSGERAKAVFELTVKADDRSDLTRQVVPIRERVYRVVRADSGRAASDMTATVTYPDDMPWEDPQLEVVIGPNVRADLLNVLSPPAVPVDRCGVVASTPLDTLTSDILAGVALQRLLEQSPDQGGPALESVRAKVDSAIASLIVMQNEEGGFSWSGDGNGVNRYSTARAVWALAAAREAGHRVDEGLLQKAVHVLKNEIPRLGVGDDESKATLLHALAVAGEGDFTLANQLHRNRTSLSAAGSAYLALTFAEMDREDTSRELTELVAAKLQMADDRAFNLGWNGSEIEARALYALCVLRTAPRTPEMTRAAQEVLQLRSGHRWQPDKATGPAMLAVCGWSAAREISAEAYELTVLVNDQEVRTLKFDRESLTQTLRIPADLLKREKQEVVRFRLKGRGEFTYRCQLSVDVPLEKLKSSTDRWFVRRSYAPSPLRFQGESIPAGFGILAGNYRSFRNELSQLPAAERGQVELSIWRGNLGVDEQDQQFEYLILTEPLPAGAVVDLSSIQGGFERYEMHPGYLLFYLGSNRGYGTIRYEITGVQPGEYFVGPSLVQDVYQPSSLRVGDSKTLKVLPEGEPSGDDYRLTPQELFELGRRKFEAGDIGGAQSHLTELLSNWNLRLQELQQTVTMLFDIHLHQQNAAEAVKLFELLIEKFPQEKIPFAKLLQVGDAYNKLGEYERSYLVFRATVEANFMVESQVAGFLLDHGEIVRSIQVMEELLKDTPQEPYAAIAEYALATDVYGNAAQAAAEQQGLNPKLTKVHFLKKSLQMLEQFLTTHPEDPSADEAAFSLASGMTELEQYRQTIAQCEKYTRRYPTSEHLSSFWYLTAFCHFALGQHEEALQMSQKVAQSVEPARHDSESVAAQNRWRAIYIMGQIHHALNQAAEAIEEYALVKDRFVDAAQAIEYFTRQAISLEEVTSFLPKDEVSLTLHYRNVKRCEVKVYRIDLMKFGLLQRNLKQITTINLAGIQPLFEKTVELGDGKDYQDRQRDVPLPLDEEGAYLIVARAENLHASGLVLISPLALDVDEDAVSGRVRVTVKDKAQDTYVDHVHVKIIGSENSDFVTGETDLRGVFVGDGIRGLATVIAQADKGKYAFFRGSTPLAVVAEDKASRPVPQSGQVAPSQADGQLDAKQELLRGIQSGNEMIQEQQRRNLERFYRNDAKDGIQNFKF